ncbi:Inner membrane transport permease YadH [Gammaproteobacteria bacterium]|nr:ABC transporter permease [Gammaproteobacteria bacterium]CAG0942782.1 Inner membrane transport permease YadH [Gammaproteobacteria bacterium]
MSAGTQLVALLTLVRKECTRVFRIWLQTILPPAMTTALYFLIFGNLIGRRIGQMDGFDYAQYIAPGLIMMQVITTSYGNVVSSFFSAKMQRHLEEMLVAPMADWAIVLGHALGGMVRGMAVAAAVTVVALLFTRLQVAHVLVTLSVVVLTAFVFALGGLINAILAKNFDDVSVIPSFVLAPLSYLGGVFYSISLLPEFAQHLSRLNPILYMVNAFRYGMLGVSDIDIGLAYAIILGFGAGLFAVCLLLIRRGTGIRS